MPVSSSPRPWHGRRWQPGGGTLARQAAPPSGGTRSEAELAALRDKVSRLASVLSRHDKGHK
jgi:hypothetical protein